MRESLTIKDIARLANVAPSTVSKALNGRSDIGAETREAVLKIAKEHNFSPNAFGKALKNKFTGNIGVIFHRDDKPLSTNPFWTRVLEGIEAESAFNNYNLVLHLMPARNKQELPKMVRERQVDGVILVGTRNEEFVKVMQAANVPHILVDPRATLSDCWQVLIDNENGAFIATQHLIERGHHEIGFIAGELSERSFQQRFNGFKKALSYHGLTLQERFVTTGESELGYERTKALLRGLDRPTAIFAANDMLALQAYKAIYELDLKIPDDLSVIGFDDIHLTTMSRPPLTTIRVYKEELGSVAVRTLRELIHRNLDGFSASVIPVKLIERESVRAVSVESI